MDFHQQLSNINLDKVQQFPLEYSNKLQKTIKEEKPLLTISTDLNLEGNYEDQWLLVTDQKLYRLSGTGQDTELITIPLAKIEDINIKNYYGVGAVEVLTKDETYEILRFTRRYGKKFRKFTDHLIEIIEGKELDMDEVFSTDTEENIQGESRCPNCGNPFIRGTATCPVCSNKSETFMRLVSYLKPYKGKVFLMLFTTIVFSILNLVDPLLQKIMIDDVILVGRLDLLKWIVIVILAVYVVRSVLQGLRTYQLSWLGQKIIYDVRAQVYYHLQKLGLPYYDRRRTGSIMNRVTGDTETIQNFIVSGVQEAIVQVFTLIIITIIMFTMDWKLALIVIIPVPFILFTTKSFRRLIRRIYHRIWRRRSNLSSIIGGAIPGIKVVKAFSQEKYESDKFQEGLDDYFTEEVRAIRFRAIFFPFISLLTSIGAVAIWGYGGYRVISINDISLGTLTAFIGYMWRFYQPIHQLSHLSEQFERATTAAERVFEILDHAPELEELSDPVPSGDIQGDIELKNVSFSYGSGDEVLKGVNLHIKPGEMVGLVGSSGAGKSTLVNLIPRFYEPTDGEIYIDGNSTNEMDINKLRSNIGVVLQEPYLFYGTVSDNISYGSPDATNEDIIRAAKAANAHKFIMNIPEGYDSMIGERGVGLSGGERQRLSIARAILKNPKILILDEATSSVDTETEKLIQEALDRLTQNRTTVAIAHRLSTLKNADRIIVLEEGAIAEEGTHDELMAIEDGVFKHLVDIQSEVSGTKFI